MEILRHPEHAYDLVENTVIGSMSITSSEIRFHGSGNVVVFPDAPSQPLTHSYVDFYGDNALLVIGENPKHPSRLGLMIYSDCTVSIGKDLRCVELLEAEVVEGTSLIVGDDCLFSSRFFCRTSDGHPIFSATTRQRTNPAASIVIGDHVWAGQNVMLLKGARVGSGSIVGTGSLVTSGSHPSNTVLAGAPARILKSGVFYDEPARHNQRPSPTPEVFDSDAYIYEHDAQTLDIDDVLKAIESEPTPLERARLLCYLADNVAKNRFYIGPS